jgi:hypothetical protein
MVLLVHWGYTVFFSPHYLLLAADLLYFLSNNGLCFYRYLH